jgi:hypothetical protein
MIKIRIGKLAPIPIKVDMKITGAKKTGLITLLFVIILVLIAFVCSGIVFIQAISSVPR